MSTEQIYDTSRLDAWLAAQRERESAMSQAAVYQARAESNRQLWKPMLAGAAGAAMVVAAVWVAMPKFVPREIEVPVVKVTRADVEVPHIVKRDVTIDAPKFVEHGSPTVSSPLPSADPSPTALPPKVPTVQEQTFVSQPEYQSAEYHGRIVGPKDNGFLFDNGRSMTPAKSVDGKIVNDPNTKWVVESFIGDYAYCNQGRIEGLFFCMVIHDGVIQPFTGRPITTRPDTADAQPKAVESPAADAASSPTLNHLGSFDAFVGDHPPSVALSPTIQPKLAVRRKAEDCQRAPMAGSCAQ